MASKTDISNRALSKVGQPRVSNIDTTNTKSARTIKYMFDMVRDMLQQSYPWNFCVTRATLAKDASSPEWGYNNRYRVPSDFLSLIYIKDVQDYRIETDATSGGKFILTNASAPLYIRYIKRVTNTGEFDPLFNEAFASRLALEACEELTQSNTKKQLLQMEYKQNISEAFMADAIQEIYENLDDDAWLLARETYNTDEIDYNA